MRGRPCGCAEHRDVDPPKQVGEHVFDTVMDQSDPSGISRWRWTCRCGTRGRWQSQSSWAAYHDWLRHVERKRK